MTKAFARLLRSFSDEQLAALGRERATPQRGYRRAMQTAIDIELDRRGLADRPDPAGQVGRRRRPTSGRS